MRLRRAQDSHYRTDLLMYGLPSLLLVSLATAGFTRRLTDRRRSLDMICLQLAGHLPVVGDATFGALDVGRLLTSRAEQLHTLRCR